MADDTIKTLLKYDVDQGSLQRVLESVSKTRAGIRAYADEIKRSQLASVEASRVIQTAYGNRLSTAFQDMRRGARDSAEEFQTLREEAAKAAKEIEDTAEKSKRIDIGGAGRGLSAISQLTGGGSALGEITGMSDDLLNVVETLPDLKNALRDIPGAVKEAVTSIGASGVGLVASIGALTIALKLYSDEQDRTRKIAEAQIAGLQQYNALVQTSTSEELETKRKTAQEAVALAETNNEQAKKLLVDLVNEMTQNLGAWATGVELAAARAGKAAGPLQAAFDAVPQTEASLASARAELDAVNRALQSTEVAANDAAAASEEAAEAEKKLATERLNVGMASIRSQIQATQEINRLTREGTQKDLDAAIAKREEEAEAIKLEGQALRELATQFEDQPEIYGQISARLQELNNRSRDLTQEYDALTNATLKATVATNDQAKTAAEETKKIRADSIAATQKYNADLAAIEERANEQRAAAADRYNEALVRAAEAAAETAENALRKLQDQRSELTTRLGRDEAEAVRSANLDRLDTLIEYQRDEARSLREHARNLAQIRLDAQRDEQDLVASRDFAGLFRLRRDTGFKLEDTQRAFNDERQERGIAYSEQIQDLTAQFQREREARIAKYQQDLSDAQAQYQREIQMAAQKRQKDIQRAVQTYNQDMQLLNQKHAAELAARRSSITSELQLIQQGSAAKLSLEAEYWRQAQALMRQARSNIAGTIALPGRPGVTAMAGGGWLEGGRAALVNEPGSTGREGFLSSGRAMRFPGMGIFVPSQGGTVDAGKGGAQFQQTNYFTGNMDEAAVSRLVERRTEALLEEYFG